MSKPDPDPSGCVVGFVVGFVVALAMALLTVFAFHLTDFQAAVVSFGFTALYMGVYS